MKLKKLINAADGIRELQNKDLPVVECFKLLNLVQQIDPHLKNYSEQRTKMLKKYGSTKDNINYTVPPENVEVYLFEMSPLEDVEINIEFQKIRINNSVKIKAVHLQNLLDFVYIEELKEGE